jgi:hypothetical protein
MINWEKENNISTKEKKKKVSRKKKDETNKENIEHIVSAKETKKEKEVRIQKEAMSKVENWVKYGKKEEWSCFKSS